MKKKLFIEEFYNDKPSNQKGYFLNLYFINGIVLKQIMKQEQDFESLYLDQQQQVVYIQMDEAELRDLIPPKQENPLLKKKPLNLGTRFWQLATPEEPVQVDNILIRPHLTLLFFSAQWCNISKSFIPTLKQFYSEVNLEDKKVEIIYVGFDKVKKQYETFTKQMPWLGLSFSDERVQGLKQFYDIRAIPKLVLVDSKGQQVHNDCRQDLYGMEPDAAYEKWEGLRNKQDKAYFYESQNKE